MSWWEAAEKLANQVGNAISVFTNLFGDDEKTSAERSSSDTAGLKSEMANMSAEISRLRSDQGKIDLGPILEEMADISCELRRMASDVSAVVVEKLDKSRLEDLAGNIDTVKLAIDMRDKHMMRIAFVALNNQMAYARARVEEGKHEWVPHWLIAENMTLLALQQLAEDEHGINVLVQKTAEYRMAVLDYAKASLLTMKKVPWTEVALFVEGKSYDLIGFIKPPAVPVPVATKPAEAKVTSNVDQPKSEEQELLESRQVLGVNLAVLLKGKRIGF